LSLLGGFQAENACLAFLSCREAVRNSEILFERDAAVSGLESSRLPGRTEIVPYCGTNFIIDGAHTPVSVRKVRDAVREVFGERGILIFGAVAGKDIQGMAQVLASSFGRILISTPGRFKESRPGEVFKTFKDINSAAEFIPEPEEALKRALALAGKELPVIVTGSFYMAAEIRKLIVR
jgi:folylpolyglutamate synthase/dihydropteroate synthase